MTENDVVLVIEGEKELEHTLLEHVILQFAFEPDSCPANRIEYDSEGTHGIVWLRFK